MAMFGVAFACDPPILTIHHSSLCQSECKIDVKNKISHEVKSLACDLMWKICVPFLTSLNIRENVEHLSHFHATHVPAGGNPAEAGAQQPIRIEATALFRTHEVEWKCLPRVPDRFLVISPVRQFLSSFSDVQLPIVRALHAPK
jgi:hypothetical protein